MRTHAENDSRTWWRRDTPHTMRRPRAEQKVAAEKRTKRTTRTQYRVGTKEHAFCVRNEEEDRAGAAERTRRKRGMA